MAVRMCVGVGPTAVVAVGACVGLGSAVGDGVAACVGEGSAVGDGGSCCVATGVSTVFSLVSGVDSTAHASSAAVINRPTASIARALGRAFCFGNPSLPQQSAAWTAPSPRRSGRDRFVCLRAGSGTSCVPGSVGYAVNPAMKEVGKVRIIAAMGNDWLDLTDGQPVEFYRVSDEAIDVLFEADDVETVVSGETPVVSVRAEGSRIELQFSKAVSEYRLRLDD